MKKYYLYLLTVLLLSICSSVNGQVVEEKVDHSPYELLSSYYNDEDFKPFKKNTWYVGLSFSLVDRQSVNSQQLTQKILDGENLNYDLLFKGGYYTQDYNMIGLNFNYYQSSFNGTVFQDPDTVQSNSLTRGYMITPNLRSSIPLTPNERLSFFVELDLNIGYEDGLSRDTKNLDDISKTYSNSYILGAAVAPGITFFAMQNFSFEIQLSVFEYQLKVTDSTIDGEEQSRIVQNNIGLNIDLLTLELGLAYNFGGK